jgi:hypothetical protein
MTPFSQVDVVVVHVDFVHILEDLLHVHGLPISSSHSLVGLKQHGLWLDKMILGAFLGAPSWTWA